MNGFDKNKIEDNISINDLILLGIHLVKEKEDNCDFESLIKMIFEISPRLISFKKNNWPDSRKIDRPLRNLKKDNFIEKSEKALYSLTKEGERKALEIIKTLYQGKLL